MVDRESRYAKKDPKKAAKLRASRQSVLESWVERGIREAKRER